MTDAIQFVARMFKALIHFLNNTCAFSLFGFRVSYLGIVCAGIIFAFVITAYWKGARA